MRFITVVLIAAMALFLGACKSTQSKQWPTQRRQVMNAWTVNDYHQDSIESGIVSQHTLYPHHFVPNGDALNELGARDVSVLAAHYRENPGALNLRRGGTTSGLYQARIDMVSAVLVQQGVDIDRVKMSNGQAGGDGMSSDRVLYILEEKYNEPLTEDTTGLTTFESD